MTALSQVECDNQKQKAEWKNFKNLQVSQNIACKIGAKKDVIVQEISTREENALQRENRKCALRASKQSAIPY